MVKKISFFYKNMFFSKFGYFLPHKISGFMFFCEKNNNKKVPKIVKNKKIGFNPKFGKKMSKKSGFFFEKIMFSQDLAISYLQNYV